MFCVKWFNTWTRVLHQLTAPICQHSKAMSSASLAHIWFSSSRTLCGDYDAFSVESPFRGIVIKSDPICSVLHDLHTPPSYHHDTKTENRSVLVRKHIGISHSDPTCLLSACGSTGLRSCECFRLLSSACGSARLRYCMAKSNHSRQCLCSFSCKWLHLLTLQVLMLAYFCTCFRVPTSVQVFPACLLVCCNAQHWHIICRIKLFQAMVGCHSHVHQRLLSV